MIEDDKKEKVGIKGMGSNILNDIWCISVYPYGVGTSSEFILAVEVIRWPRNVKQIDVKVVFTIDGIDDEPYEDKDKFTLQHTYTAVENPELMTSLRTCHAVAFVIDVEILKITCIDDKDRNELCINDPAKIAYLLSK